MFDYQMLEGIFAPIVTPFYEDESIDLQSLKENIRKYNRTGLKGYMPLGSNGEFQSLSDEESIRVLDAVEQTRESGKIVVGGCGRESAMRTVDTIKLFYGHGLDMAFVLPPHYFAKQITEKNLYEFYLRVAEGSPIPVVIYNAPKFASGIDLSPELIARLAEHDNIVALKNSNSAPDQEYTRACEGLNFRIIAGSISKLYPSLDSGSVGGVISTASYWPEACCEIYDLFRAGQKEASEALWKRTSEFSKAGIGACGVCGVKYGMELRGFTGGHVRVPLIELEEDRKAQIRQLFDQYEVRRFEEV